MIAIDQENGMLNNLYDDDYITQFPGSMAMVATQSLDMARQVAKATGKELKALGINWTLGPVVDVLSNSTNKLLGVRTMGDDPKEVTEYALAFLEGYREAGIATCGKHFPGYGNATVDETLALPIVYDTIEQLETASLIPYRQIIKKDIDSIMVGSCALPKITMSVMHACLSERVVRGMLRDDMGFDGVIVSECLEMKTLYEDVGVRQGTVLAALAGCDVIIVCSSFRLQLEALSGILGAVRDGIITREAVKQSAERIMNMKRKHLSWEEALNPPSLEDLKKLHLKNQKLSKDAYERSVTILRDHGNYIPLSKSIEPDADILLLTPLVVGTIPRKSQTPVAQQQSLLAGEDVFHDFGRYLARYHTGKITHTSYTDKGMSAIHESLLEKAKTVIVVTTDASRNTYQVQFTKTIGLICTQQRKPMIAIAASSPYDLALDRGVGTYICLYEFTPQSLETASRVLFGKLQAKGRFPGSGLYQSRGVDMKQLHVNPKRRWLVEKFTGDFRRLKVLWENCFPDRLGIIDYLRALINAGNSQTHFIVRNSSTQQLYGFCATWVHEDQNVGCIIMLFVDPFRRSRSIGQSLHERALKYLLNERKVSSVRLGSRVPSYFEGIPLSLRLDNVRISRGSISGGSNGSPGNTSNILEAQSPSISSSSLPSTTFSSTSSSSISTIAPGSYNPIDLVEWFRHMGWHIPRAAGVSAQDTIHTMELMNLKSWHPQKNDLIRFEKAGIKLRLASKSDTDKVLALARHAFKGHPRTAGLFNLYKEVIERNEANIILAVSNGKKNLGNNKTSNEGQQYAKNQDEGSFNSGESSTALSSDFNSSRSSQSDTALATALLSATGDEGDYSIEENNSRDLTGANLNSNNGQQYSDRDNRELSYSSTAGQSATTTTSTLGALNANTDDDQEIYGSIIIFSRSSMVAYYMPWLLEFDSARVGGMCGLICDPGSQVLSKLGSEDEMKKLRNTILWGLIACGLQAFKDSKWQTFRNKEFDMCCISGIDGPYMGPLQRMGFKEVRRYLEVCEYDQIGANNTPLQPQSLSKKEKTKTAIEKGQEKYHRPGSSSSSRSSVDTFSRSTLSSNSTNSNNAIAASVFGNGKSNNKNKRPYSTSLTSTAPYTPCAAESLDSKPAKHAISQ